MKTWEKRKNNEKRLQIRDKNIKRKKKKKPYTTIIAKRE